MPSASRKVALAPSPERNPAEPLLRGTRTVDIAMMDHIERTLPALFESSVRRFGKNVMMWEKRDGAYRGTTFEEIQASAHRCAAGLVSLGVKKGDRIALISEGRNEWVISELGILSAGAINVPLSTKIEESSELKFRLAHAGCRMAVVSGTQSSKVSVIKKDLPDLERIILLDGKEVQEGHEYLFRDLLERGAEYLANHWEEYDQVRSSIRESDPANICYTSGTVADPKGIVLTHRNYTANVAQSIALYPLPESSCTLLILPWDHAFGHTAGVYALSSTGGSMASVQVGKNAMETLRNIPVNIKEVRPTFLLSVPALAKNFRKGIEKGIREKGKVVEELFHLALKVAYSYGGNGWDRGRGWRRILKPVYLLFDMLLFRKVRENFGGRLEYFIGGGALLDIELQRFFYALGIPMYQGYGLTEAAPVISANTQAKHKLGSSGLIVPDLKLKICDPGGRELPVGQHGEIVVKGENVMAGYWRNEKATAEALRDGWLFTGDLGYLDADGFLYVLGREKSLLIGHDGEKYSPEGIEEMIVENSLFIDQIMLYNNQSPYTVALVVPNRDAVLGWFAHQKLSSEAEKTREAILVLLGTEINAYHEGGKHSGMFPERWLPSALAVLDEPFTEQNRLLNSTLKIVRGRIAMTYRDRLEMLFTAEGKNICHRQNMAAIGRLCEKS